MRKYLSIFRAGFQEALIYRWGFFFNFLSSLIHTIALIFFWFLAYAPRGNVAIGGFTKEEMLIYLLGVGLMQGFVHFASQGDEVNTDISHGYLGTYLVKPFSPSLYWFVKDFGERLLSFGMGFLAYAFLFLIFQPDLSFFTFPRVLLFFGFLFLAGVIHFLIFHIFALFAFWIDETWGFRFLMRVFMEIASGLVIPLTFIPGIIGKILLFLPFQYFGYFPIATLMGKISGGDIIRGFFLEAFWIFLLFGLASFVWKRGLKYYSVAESP